MHKNIIKMKAIFSLLVLLILSTSAALSQTDPNLSKVGDAYRIGEVVDNDYNYVLFPRRNSIRKRGGIPDYKSMAGKKVVITKLKEQKGGTIMATIKLASGKRFFNSHKYVQIILDKAIESGEIVQ